MNGFEKLERIVVLNIEYKTRGNLSINTGHGDGIRDNLVIRGGGFETDPVISGSSVKGVVRSTIEALLTQASESQSDPKEKERLKVCIPITCFEKDHLPPNRFHPDHCIKAKPCLVCQMFGNTQHKGRVIFHDAKLPKDSNISTISRTHVAIDRNTGTARGGALMTIETVPSGAVFNGSIVLINPDKWMVGAIYDVMSKLIPKIGIGSKTTNGYGELDICIDAKLPLRPRNEKEETNAYINSCLDEWKKLLGVNIN
ncbi:MAG: RAMP superfamily CRISPR-associated protein [bacterium]